MEQVHVKYNKFFVEIYIKASLVHVCQQVLDVPIADIHFLDALWEEREWYTFYLQKGK